MDEQQKGCLTLNATEMRYTTVLKKGEYYEGDEYTRDPAQLTPRIM